MKLTPVLWLALALMVTLAWPAQAQTDDTPADEASGDTGAEEEEPRSPDTAETVPWTDSEIAAAKDACDRALDAVTLDYQPLPPIKDGLCGAPAPILVSAIGSDPKVAIDPPATLTCPLAKALDVWLEDRVQPEAEARLGSAVVKLTNAASYVCRNRYGSAGAPLSEHALANALDVSAFVLETGEHLTVLQSWPRVVAFPPLPQPNPARPALATPAVSRADTDMAPSAATNPFVPANGTTNPFVAPVASGSATSEAEPDDAPTAAVERTAAFVRKVHEDACRTFGTTLGPEANEAHKDHFHFDMKKRRTGFCE